MRVENLMTTKPTTCSTTDHLAAAAQKMWDDDCGILPVVDAGALEGVITDRDIAMALGMRGASAREVRVGEVITGRIFGCAPDDEITDALEVMREHEVRRLVVLDEGELVGLLSLNDIVLEASAEAGQQSKPTYGEVLSTFKAICSHRHMPVAV